MNRIERCLPHIVNVRFPNRSWLWILYWICVFCDRMRCKLKKINLFVFRKWKAYSGILTLNRYLPYASTTCTMHMPIDRNSYPTQNTHSHKIAISPFQFINWWGINTLANAYWWFTIALFGQRHSEEIYKVVWQIELLQRQRS